MYGMCRDVTEVMRRMPSPIHARSTSAASATKANHATRGLAARQHDERGVSSGPSEEPKLPPV